MFGQLLRMQLKKGYPMHTEIEKIKKEPFVHFGLQELMLVQDFMD